MKKLEHHFAVGNYFHKFRIHETIFDYNNDLKMYLKANLHL